MFTFLFILLLAGAGAVFMAGIRTKRTSLITAGALLLVMVLAFFRFLHFWGEKLWFDQLGYTSRFWILELAQYGFGLAGLLLGALVVRLLLWQVPAARRWIRYPAMALGAFFAMMWGYNNWEVLLLFLNRVPTEVVDPVFGQPGSFYFFSLPFYNSLLGLLIGLNMLCLIASLLIVFVEPNMWRQFNWNRQAFSGFVDPVLYKPLFTTAGVFLLLQAVNVYFNRYAMLLSDSGVVFGPGWTDVNVRLPMMWVVMIGCALAGLLILIPALRSSLQIRLSRKFRWLGSNPASVLILVIIGLVAIWVVALGVIPGLFQSFKVNPNEITMERPYIMNNIEFTRLGYGLDRISEQQYPMEGELNSEAVAENKGIFSNIRLWDYRALGAVYKQFQEFRLYYEFEDIDIDRYRYNGEYNQVMIAAREMEVNNLPPQSQTFVNRKFKYTHGYGVVMNNVSEFTPSGLPDFLIRDIPPQSRFPELEVAQPRIYYGEGSDDYVVVNTAEEEFDYPQGDGNAYIRYDGRGGVPLQNYWRQFLYAYKFDESKLLFSGYPGPESRLMFHRNIQDRVKRLAPFLSFDDDPFIVLSEGRLYWIIDAYTTSRNFPYSQPFSALEDVIIQGPQTDPQLRSQTNPVRGGVNYIRNSVKVVVDAYHGSVDFYMFDQQDPLIQVWDRVVPGLLKPWQEMPEGLLEHIRYPADLLLVQGVVYAKYHMLDPTVFYNQEDLWVRATEKYFDQVRPVEPYYVMWERPEADAPSFVLMIPFTPKNRQVLIGWLAGMCDPENYGELIAYNFPKDKRVLGPQQVETKIDQDPNLSSQLSLWNQRGSNVIRGNVLAIPVNKTLFYVEPIYLQAETAAYPELRMVVIMHNDQMVYAPTFEEALRKMLSLTGSEALSAESAGEEESLAASDTTGMQEMPRQLNQRVRAANQAFEDYLRYTGERNYEEASEALQRLEENLKALEKEE